MVAHLSGCAALRLEVHPRTRARADGPTDRPMKTPAASKSNKTEMLRPMIWSLLLTPCVATAYTYFIYLQLYVCVPPRPFPARARPGPAPTTTRAAPRRLRVDVIMNAIGIIFVGLELPFQLVVCFHFSTAIYI